MKQQKHKDCDITYSSICQALILETSGEPLLHSDTCIMHLLRSPCNFFGNDVALITQSPENNGISGTNEIHKRPPLVLRLVAGGRPVVKASSEGQLNGIYVQNTMKTGTKESTTQDREGVTNVTDCMAGNRLTQFLQMKLQLLLVTLGSHTLI
jgi:hypothetical protein